jgi:membrane protein
MWSAAGTRLRDRPLWVFQAIAELLRDWVARFFAVQAFDRAMSIGAYAYTALFPLLIVSAALLPHSGTADFADVLIDEFNLTGSTAKSVELAFTPAGGVQAGVSALGVVLLLYSMLSFSRGLQRLYEAAYGLPTLGMRNTPRGLLWLGFITVLFIVCPTLMSPLSGVARLVATVAIGVACWLVTPYLLLGRRLPWRRLVPTALLTAAGMAGVAVWSVLWMPHTIAASAEQFGVIGIGFALMSWLFAAAIVIVIATAGGVTITDRLEQRGAP